MDYEWNPEKAERNLEKHSVSFEEAATVFDDPLYVDFFDLITQPRRTDISSWDCPTVVVYYSCRISREKV